jgi:hypothetical protein
MSRTMAGQAVYMVAGSLLEEVLQRTLQPSSRRDGVCYC